jgi:apolipoprotein N-acyltransferase
VRVGKYKERSEADTVAARLQKEEQFKPWIVSNADQRSRAAHSRCAAALSFPKYGHPAVAFIALVPLLVALRAASPRRGFIARLHRRLHSLRRHRYWTGATVSTFGGLPVFVACSSRPARALHGRLHRGVRRDHGDPDPPLSSRGLVARAGGVGLDGVLRGILIGGFPWIPLGNTMVTFLPIAQLASLVGVLRLSLFVGVLNAGFASRASRRAAPHRAAARRRPDRRRVAVGRHAARVEHADAGAPIKVGLIQGNIAQTDKWNPARAGMILDRYLQLSQQAVDKGAQFLIWPSRPRRFISRTIRRASCAAWCASSACRCCSAATKSSRRSAEELQLRLHARYRRRDRAVYRKIPSRCRSAR